MITTVCLNPAFDQTATVDRFSLGQVNRLKDIRYDVGGKGINVGIALKRLGMEVQCLCCLGEANEAEFVGLLAQEELPFERFLLTGKTRTNTKVLDAESRVVTEFNEPGLWMDAQQQERFLAFFGKKAQGSEYVALSGSLPQGCPSSFYQRCMQTFSKPKWILDTVGESLEWAMKEKPFLIKPNAQELEGLVGKRLPTLLELRNAAHALTQTGVQHVVVSLGKQGALWVTLEKTWFAPALSVKSESTVGAGDAMLAGILMGLSQGGGIEDALRCGTAAGAASVMTEGTQLLRLSDFEALLPLVRLEER